jgi:hypothetical protein
MVWREEEGYIKLINILLLILLVHVELEEWKVGGLFFTSTDKKKRHV